MGAVLALDFAQELGRCGLLFSCSSDRTIKIWDPWGPTEPRAQGAHEERTCVQTLIGHSAGVTCVKVVARQHNGLVTSSLDRSVRTWYPSEGRALLLYPWFVPGQIIELPGNNWPTSLTIRPGAHSSLFVADSGGCISLFTAGCRSSEQLDVVCHDRDHLERHFDLSFVAPQVKGNSNQHNESNDSILSASEFEFQLKRRFPHFHSLGISSLQLVADNCFVVSLGFDEKAQVIDAISGSLSATITCPSGSRFTCCCWDQQGELLLLGDTRGVIYVWSILEDKIVGKKSASTMQDASGIPIIELVDLIMISPYIGCSWVFTGFASGVQQWLVNRDVGYNDFLGHTQGVVSIVVMNDDEYDFLLPHVEADIQALETEGVSTDGETPPAPKSAKFYSASLDNTIRCWDSYDQKATFGFEERTSEITCMIESKKFRKLFTGHDNGTLKAWGVNSGQYFQGSSSTKSSITCLGCTVYLCCWYR